MQRTLIGTAALALASFTAGASHPPVVKHRAHLAESHSPHASQKRKPHVAGKHPKPLKAPKHEVAQHQKPRKLAKR